MRKTGSKLE